MTDGELRLGLEFLRSQAESRAPGEIVNKANLFITLASRNLGWSNRKSTLFVNLLIYSGYVSLDGLWLKLTDEGYALMHDDGDPKWKVDLVDLTSAIVAKDKKFYEIWELIGGDKSTNPLYVSGVEFYDAAKSFIGGLPQSYTEYIAELKKQGKPTSRSRWCKDLFLMIPDEGDLEQFMIMLSETINSRNNAVETHSSSIDEFDAFAVTVPQSTVMPEMKIDIDNLPVQRVPKVFISHNHQDADYAKALVDMMLALGVNEKDIFCSSYPGFGVPFGKSFLDGIKGQYDEFDLLVLFVHSPRYYESPVSLCEMGAAWITKTDYRSFLTKDCEFKNLCAVIPPTETAFRAGETGTYHLLNDFKILIETTFSLPAKDFTRWETIKGDFINAVSR
ncbi:hypothetical protein [Bacteroides acidifaciens]|uniref:hypothetical protein n=1 Tax=Bacteroides acidifaciens TaxID=85831 RepID=UPI00260F84FE|nr:hypothetical protein [Bacteroides acidifaciens]